jgi:hypothetical protein
MRIPPRDVRRPGNEPDPTLVEPSGAARKPADQARAIVQDPLLSAPALGYALRVMDPADVRSLLERDWNALAEGKDDAWLACRQRFGEAWGLRVGEALRLHAKRVRPGWPSARERRADLAMHLRMIDVLHRTPRCGR